MAEQEPKKQLKELLEGFDTAMLVTRLPTGELRSRPMSIADKNGTSEIWFASELDTAKIAELERDPHVNVSLQRERAFVSLSGRADVVRDRKKIDELWHEYMKIWFPKGKDDPSLCLVRVEVHTAEFWDAEGAKGLRYLFEAAKAYIKGTTPAEVEGQHGTVGRS